MNKLKIKKIEKLGKYLYIYIKIPYFIGFKKISKQLAKYEDNEASLHTYIDIKSKYAILTYVLRNKEDILPYVNNRKVVEDE